MELTVLLAPLSIQVAHSRHRLKTVAERVFEQRAATQNVGDFDRVVDVRDDADAVRSQNVDHAGKRLALGTVFRFVRLNFIGEFSIA